MDEAVIRCLLEEAGFTLGPVHIAGGKPSLRRRISGYNAAARRSPWLVIVDLDRDAECAPQPVASWLPARSAFMCFRIAVREVEAWLLADRLRLAQFLAVPRAVVPAAPEALVDPKQQIVNLARRSRNRDVREDMVPRPQSGRTEGAAYASRLIEYSRTYWRPAVAERHSDSLRRCRRALNAIANRFSGR